MAYPSLLRLAGIELTLRRWAWPAAWVGLLAACSPAEPPGTKDQPLAETGLSSPATSEPTDGVDTGGGDGDRPLPLFLLAGQSNQEGHVDRALFDSLLEELGRGPEDDLAERLQAALEYWYFEVDEGYASYGYTSDMAALQIASLIRFRDQGLVGADLTAPHPETTCRFNEAPAEPLALNCGFPFGPELMAGHLWSRTDQPKAGFVKVARGGTTLFTDWRSPSAGGEVGPDYLRLRDRITSLQTEPEALHPACATEACAWSALVWFQGENDSFDPAHAAAYEANLEGLLADVRAEVGVPDLPVILVQTGAWAQSLDAGAEVAAAQERVAARDPAVQLVVTDDLSGFYHYDPAAQLIIGERVAEALQAALGE